MAVEAACKYNGEYRLSNDTIYFDNSFILIDSTFSKKYLIDKSSKYLVPIISNNERIENKKLWFDIIKMNNP